MPLREVLKRYFKTRDGIYHPEHQITTAYYLITGKKASEDLDDYYSFVESIMGKAVIGCFQAKEIEITEEFFANQRLACCRVYQEANQCTLGEAKQILEKRFGWRSKK